MKLDDLLKKYPWDETREMLCADPPDQGDLPLDRARELIIEQRDSQIQILAHEMYGPRLLTELPSPADLELTEPALPRFEFAAAEYVAATFLRVAAQVGASLRPFEPMFLEAELDSADALLGRLLRLLAIAEEPVEGPHHPPPEWMELAMILAAQPEQQSSFGLVLGPMLSLASSAGRWREFDYDLVRPLMTELSATDRSDELAKWTVDLVEAGSRQIAAISSLSHSPRLPPQIDLGQAKVMRYDIDAIARDIVLAGGREENEGFLAAVQGIDGVVADRTKFIYEPQPGVVRVRAWSREPLKVTSLTKWAESANVQVIEIADDTTF